MAPTINLTLQVAQKRRSEDKKDLFQDKQVPWSGFQGTPSVSFTWSSLISPTKESGATTEYLWLPLPILKVLFSGMILGSVSEGGDKLWSKAIIKQCVPYQKYLRGQSPSWRTKQEKKRPSADLASKHLDLKFPTLKLWIVNVYFQVRSIHSITTYSNRLQQRQLGYVAGFLMYSSLSASVYSRKMVI